MHIATRSHLLAGLVGIALVTTACGGSGGPGSGTGGPGNGAPGASAAPAQSKVVLASADAAKPISLQAGGYKVAWDAPGCTSVDFSMTGATKGFTWTKKSHIPTFSTIVFNVPEDSYIVAQTVAACATWTLTFDKVSG